MRGENHTTMEYARSYLAMCRDEAHSEVGDDLYSPSAALIWAIEALCYAAGEDSPDQHTRDSTQGDANAWIIPLEDGNTVTVTFEDITWKIS